MLEASWRWFHRASAALKRATTDAVYARSTFLENTLNCPATSCGATVLTLQDQESGRHTDVVRCSELHGEETCAHGCLAQLKPASTKS
jgi:hypothetical protein